MRLCTSYYMQEELDLLSRERLMETQKKWSGKEIYHCTMCGQLGYLSADEGVMIPRVILPAKDMFPIHLVNEENIVPADLNELLKFDPGYTVLSDVIEKIGRPFALHKLKTGNLLCYHSKDAQNPHTILVDALYGSVKLVAIHNDFEAFDLNNLGKAYGQQEFVMRTDGYEFWIYESHGVAKVTEGFSDEAILYVQFFEKRLGLDGYLELNCFLEETFR